MTKTLLILGLIAVCTISCANPVPSTPPAPQAAIDRTKPKRLPPPVSQFKRQTELRCGEIASDDGAKFILPLSKVPQPMQYDYDYAWKLEILNAETITLPSGAPVLLDNWDEAAASEGDWTVINRYRPLLGASINSTAANDYIVFGMIENPGWGDGLVAKIFSDGTFVVAKNLGECVAVGNLEQFKTDYDTFRQRLIDDGLLSVGRDPLSLGTDHYGVTFLGISQNGVLELRSDADEFERMLKEGSAPKRDAFRVVYEKEKLFINQLLTAGMSRQAK